MSGEVIPTMMSEMGLAELKLKMVIILKFLSTSYRAHIHVLLNKEAAFNWLRQWTR